MPNLEIGDALIHHVLVAHGSKNNKSDLSRAGVTFQIKDRKSKYDKKDHALQKKTSTTNFKKIEIY